MRKLAMASFGFKTGDREYEETRLFFIEVVGNATEQQERDELCDLFKPWFKDNYPESELLSLIPKLIPNLVRNQKKIQKPSPINLIIYDLVESSEHLIDMVENGADVQYTDLEKVRKIAFEVRQTINQLESEFKELPKLMDFASKHGDAEGYARLCGQMELIKRFLPKI